MKKTGIFVTLLLVACCALTGCSSNADMLPTPTPYVNATNSPVVMPTASPNVGTMNNTNTPTNPSNAPITTIESAKTVSDDVEEVLEKLTEVKDATAVVVGSKALIGVEFDDQYQGDLDERMQKMVYSRVKGVHPNITSVYFAKDDAQMRKLNDLEEKMDTSNSLSQINSEAEELCKSMLLYQE